MDCLDEFIRVLIAKKYSENTIKNYKSVLRLFLIQLSVPAGEVRTEEIRDYLHYKVLKERISSSTQKQVSSAIKLFYKEIYGRELRIRKVYYRNKFSKSVTVFSKVEIKELLSALENLKHRALITCIYSIGLRISEVTCLKIRDVDTHQMIINVRGRKGHQDRKVALSSKLLVLLRSYHKEYKPIEFLFEGREGKAYSAGGIRKIFQKGLQKAGIMKKANLPALRHSFASHLIQNGIDIRHVQAIMGHKSIKTTQQYADLLVNHKVAIRNPVDDII